MSLAFASSLAFLVNLSVFLVIARTSPIAYQVLGHFKLVVVLAGGIVFFGGDVNPKRLAGMACTFIGVVIYSHLNQTISENWDKKKDGILGDVSKPKPVTACQRGATFLLHACYFGTFYFAGYTTAYVQMGGSVIPVPLEEADAR
jgi:hypothetical protein